MGLFFEDPKPPEPPQVTVVHEKQDWLAMIIGAIIALIGAMLMITVKAVAYIARPLFAYLFTFEGRTRQQIMKQMCIAAILIFGPFALLYVKSPGLRDFISLSNTHTINRTNGYRIMFPDRSKFTTGGEHQAFRVEQYDSCTYVTYAGYTENHMEKALPNYCFMVPRGKLLGLSSMDLPTNAEGFVDEVSYTIRARPYELDSWSYRIWIVINPRYWFKPKEEQPIIQREKTGTWKELAADWYRLWSFDDGYKPFEIKALSSEHAVVRF